MFRGIEFINVFPEGLFKYFIFATIFPPPIRIFFAVMEGGFVQKYNPKNCSLLITVTVLIVNFKACFVLKKLWDNKNISLPFFVNVGPCAT